MDCLKTVVWSLNTKHEDLKWEGTDLCGCGDCILDYTLFTVIAQSCISDLLHDVLIGMQIIRYLSVPHSRSFSEADPCTVWPSCLPTAFYSSVVWLQPVHSYISVAVTTQCHIMTI